MLWHNHVRLSSANDGAAIEHAITRTAPRNTVLAPKASSPRIIEELIKTYGGSGIEPRDLYVSSTRCEDAAAAAAFVEHVLLDSARTVPILVATPRAGTAALTVDPVILAKQLRGMAMIAVLSTREATNALTDELAKRGFPRQFTCVDGGARLYAPKLSTNDPLYRHPLWIRSWLLGLDDIIGRRTDWLGGIVAARIAISTMPADLLSSIHDFDRQERRRAAERLLAADATASFTAAEPTSADVAARDQKITSLEAALRDANEMIELYADENRQLDVSLSQTEDEKAKAEYDAQAANLKAEALQQSLQQLKDKQNGDIPEAVRQAVSALLADEPTPEHALRLAAITWPERLTVLESAYRSSRESELFQRPREVASLLARLAIDYYDILATGTGDHDARKVFGKDEFAATESESVMNSRGAVKRRTFIYKGVPTEMFKHLKIGIKDSVAETMRIHFIWDADERKLVIGHCGPHLDFS